MKKFFLASALLLLGACAQKAAVTINPQEFTILPKLATLTKAKPGATLAVSEFLDTRRDQSNIGLSQKKTPILLAGGVEKYMTQRFIEGLEKRNIQVTDAAAYTVKGTIKKLQVNELAPGFSPQSSQCELDLRLSLQPKDSHQSTYWWEGTTSAQGTKNVFNTTSSDGPVLDACVNEAIEKFLHNEKIQKALGIQLLSTETPAQGKTAAD
jgi:hypothetical protein